MFNIYCLVSLFAFVLSTSLIEDQIPRNEVLEFANVPHCGMPAFTRKVYGGVHTQIGEDPWIALLMFRDVQTKKVEYICTGSLINHRYVITAAHCLKDRFLESKWLYHVRLGEHNISSPYEDAFGLTFGSYDFEVEDFISHPQFNEDSFFSNDIALIRLAQPVDFQLYLGQIYAVCLPSRNEQELNTIRRGFKTVGWNFGAGRPSDTLMESRIELVNDDKCSKVYRGYIGSGKLCTLPQDNVCVGDSGSPLVAYRSEFDQQYLMGVLSITVPSICQRYPTLYTSILPFIDWIIENTSDE